MWCQLGAIQDTVCEKNAREDKVNAANSFEVQGD